MIKIIKDHPDLTERQNQARSDGVMRNGGKSLAYGTPFALGAFTIGSELLHRFSGAAGNLDTGTLGLAVVFTAVSATLLPKASKHGHRMVDHYTGRIARNRTFERFY